jgi:hypothetical protein
MELFMKQIKTVFEDLKKQANAAWKYLLLSFYVPAFIVLFTAVMMTLVSPSIEPQSLFRDITASTGSPFYTGFVSQLGALLWAASVTTCLFALYVLKNINSGSSQSRRFLLHAGLFSAFLMLDDMFLFHEEVARDYLGLGQKEVYLAYLLIAASFLYFNRAEILSSDYLIMGLALVMFGLSISLDSIEDLFYEQLRGSLYEKYEVFYEDGFKFLGIVTWLAFYVRYIKNTFAPLFSKVRMDKN